MPQIEHVHQRLHAHVGGRHNHRERGAGLADALQQRDAVGVRETHVENQNVGLEGVQLTHRLGPVGRVRHGVLALKEALIGVL